MIQRGDNNFNVTHALNMSTHILSTGRVDYAYHNGRAHIIGGREDLGTSASPGDSIASYSRRFYMIPLHEDNEQLLIDAMFNQENARIDYLHAQQTYRALQELTNE